MKNHNCPRSTSRRDDRSNGPFSGRQLDLKRSEGVLEISWGGLTMSEAGLLACIHRCRVMVANVAVGRVRSCAQAGTLKNGKCKRRSRSNTIRLRAISCYPPQFDTKPSRAWFPRQFGNLNPGGSTFCTGAQLAVNRALVNAVLFGVLGYWDTLLFDAFDNLLLSPGATR
jgi:hypothetical protein